MTVIFTLPILAVKVVAELLFGTTEIEQRKFADRARAELLCSKGF